MSLLAFCFLVAAGAVLVIRLIGLQVEVRHLHQTMDMRDRQYLAQFRGEEREAERRLVNILRRARGVPPL